MKDNPVAKNAHKFNKSQVMKDRKKAMKKGERKHKGKMEEKLSASDDAGEWVKDFRKSDAPQFKGKTDKEKQRMAIAAYLDAKREKREAMEEKNKGLWHNIHQKRKRGERPAKPGEKGYPKTLDIDEDVHARYMRVHGKKARGQGRWIFTTSRNSQSQGKEFVHRGDFTAAHKAAQKHFGTKDVYVMEGKNTPGDGNPCWDTHKKVGTKMKNGKRVNDCVPKNESTQIEEKSVHVRLDHLDGDPRQSKATDVLKKYEKSKAIEFDGETDKGAIFKVLKPAMISGLNRELKKFATSAVNEGIIEGSAQDRLNKRAAKLGIGNRNKAADDYMARMKAKHGEKGVADRLASNQAKIDAIKKARQRREGVNEELTPVQKRKYMNLKKRAKGGNSQAKIRLKSFEKEFAKDIEMGKTSAKSVKTGGKVGAADPTTGQFGSGGSGQGDNMNLIVQLRKAQDLNGKEPVKLKGNKSVTIPKPLIDKILAKYDTIQKPQDKKKFELLVTKELRKKAK